jgi:hypothetical protein
MQMETSATLRQVEASECSKPIDIYSYVGIICCIIAANIDGETNLKVREAPASLLDFLGAVISEGYVSV